MPGKPSPAIAPVVKTVNVDCSPGEAFHFFTADFAQWWPLATHSCVGFMSEFKETPESCIFEPRTGGRIVEYARSGEEHLWGTVLAWEPPSRVAFSWHPGREASLAQTVEVTFHPMGENTRVVLTHSGFESLGETAEAERDGYNNGWEAVFVAAFTEYANRKN